MKPVKDEMASAPGIASPTVPEVLRREIEAFLYREARVLDERDYDTWLAMLAPDIHYWMPVIENRKNDDPAGNYGPGRMAYFDDDLRYLQVRVKRLQASTAWSEDPSTRQVHVVTNIEVEASVVPNEFVVHSILLSYRNRGERDEGMQFARRQDLLRLTEGHWLLARRKILLTQNVLLSRNINTFF
jgi:ethylbenzene dioxygenase beta subunit